MLFHMDSRESASQKGSMVPLHLARPNGRLRGGAQTFFFLSGTSSILCASCETRHIFSHSSEPSGEALKAVSARCRLRVFQILLPASITFLVCVYGWPSPVLSNALPPPAKPGSCRRNAPQGDKEMSFSGGRSGPAKPVIVMHSLAGFPRKKGMV